MESLFAQISAVVIWAWLWQRSTLRQGSLVDQPVRPEDLDLMDEGQAVCVQPWNQ